MAFFFQAVDSYFIPKLRKITIKDMVLDKLMHMKSMPGKSRTALVLAGGGLTGAVYEIGALRAINDLLIDRTVNDFDIYVGTSAGALIASSLANGISAETMMQANAGFHPDIPPVLRKDIFNLSRREFLKRGLKLPRIALGAWVHYLRHLGDMSLFDVIWSLLEVLPAGIYDGLALERYVRRVLSTSGMSNRFRELEKELYIIATDLDNGDRAIFGNGYSRGVPISLAVAASTAVPLVYKPVMIHGREYVDGGLRGTASLDLAIEHGAKLVICINPLVPYNNAGRDQISLIDLEGDYLSEKGLQAIASQVTRISMHSGLHYHIKQLRRSNPDVDIILIEPRPDDSRMFFYNVMRYSARLVIARHGFESATVDLAQDYPKYKEILSRHGIAISRRLVIEELNAIQESEYDPTVIRNVLEARPFSGQVYSRKTLDKLDQILLELDKALNEMSSSQVVS